MTSDRDAEQAMASQDSQPGDLQPTKIRRADIVGVHRGIRFDNTVNTGMLISAIALLGVMLGIWNTQDRRTTVLEEQIKVQRVIDQAQDYQRDSSYRELKESMTKVERQLERLGDNINTRRPLSPSQ